MAEAELERMEDRAGAAELCVADVTLMHGKCLRLV